MREKSMTKWLAQPRTLYAQVDSFIDAAKAKGHKVVQVII